MLTDPSNPPSEKKPKEITQNNQSPSIVPSKLDSSEEDINENNEIDQSLLTDPSNPPSEEELKEITQNDQFSAVISSKLDSSLKIDKKVPLSSSCNNLKKLAGMICLVVAVIFVNFSE